MAAVASTVPSHPSPTLGGIIDHVIIFQAFEMPRLINNYYNQSHIQQARME